MEVEVESSNGGKLSRKSRSMDLKSIFKPNSLKKNDKVSVSEGKSLKRMISSNVEGESEMCRRKRSKKELPLSFLKTGGKNAKKSLAKVYSDEIGSGCGTTKDTGIDHHYVSGQRVHCDRNEEDSENGMLLGLEGGTIQIPKKRRRFVGRKKYDSQQSLKSASQSNCKCDFGDEEVKINSKTDFAVEISDARGMEVKELDEHDKKLINLRNPDQNDYIGYAITDKDTVASLRKKSCKKRRMKGVDNSVEEDEKNLEENAAMMLLSRFDPSCTGFSLNSKASASPTTNRSLFQPHNSGQSDSAGGLDFVSPNMADRVLRPRSQHKSKSFSRKRRHFYEIIPKPFNGHRLLKKRIKVFWPLDDSWYSGLINDYDDERQLHHIKYDDWDEERVDLCNEKFKLLLFPSEFPNRSSRRKTGLTDMESRTGKAEGKTRKEGRKKKLNTDDDNSASNNVDTMPITSWMTRTNSVSSRGGKKQKTSVSSMHSIVSSMSDNMCNSELRVNDGTTKRASRKSQRESVLPKEHSPGRKKTSLSSTPFREKKSSLSFKGDKLPIVYFRQHRKTSDTFRKHDRVYSSSVGADEAERNRSFGISLQKSDLKSSYRLLQEILSELTILPTQPELCDLKLSVPVLPLLNHYLGDENDKFFRTLFLLHQGSLMMTWPKIRLEILLVDNLSELRFLVFEGTLEKAMTFCFFLLRVMDCGNGVENNEEEQLPMMSINLRFTRMQGIQTKFLFAAYRFVSLKHSQWMYIDSNLMTKCLIARRLSLSECSDGNLSVLQDCASKLPLQFVYGCLIKDLHSLKEPGISRETCNGSDIVIQLFQKLKIDARKVPILAFPDVTVNISKTAGIKLLMDSFYSDIMAKEHDVVEISKICSTGGNAGDFPDVQHAGVGPPSNLSFSKGNDGVIGRTWEGTGFSSFPSTVPCVPVSEISKWVDECENSIVKSEKYPIHLPQSRRVQSGSHSFSNDTLGVKKLARPHDKELSAVPVSSTWNGAVVPNSNPTALRNMLVRRRTNSSYRTLSSMGSDVRDDSFKNGFVNGPKRPRTQVSYLLPYESLDLSPKSRNSQNRIASHKRIRRLKEKDVPDVSKDFDLLSCDANVLISLSDRGWRETGAVVVLELDNQNEWKLVVKISGTLQYSYKAHQFLQPGSTNRFTHAMMWRGGKDWVLEFTNRSQWTLFKEMNEECYNRSVRAASVKAIPIPGVHMIDENEDSGAEELFVRSSSKYMQQVESDVEMALNPSHVLYDMDSEDEQWILANCSLDAENSQPMEISDDIFERTMDAFEKVAYTRQRDQFSSNEIEEFMAGVEPIEIVKSIHDFWWKKRQKKGMSLIRHLQPPSWERYQQKVKEWELAVNKTSSSLSSDCHKVSATEKPPMFAFCMKPRGLEVPNKGPKQRSRRKFSVSGTAGFADQNGFHALGRRSSGNHFGNGKFIYPSNRGDLMGDFGSPRLYSPRDVAGPRYLSLGNYGYYNSRVSRKKPKRIGALISPRDPISYSRRDGGWKKGFKLWNSDWSNHRSYYLEEFERSDIKILNCVEADDFTVMDASGTARHAQKIARWKREKAERMFHRPDRALHKALAALMTVEAIKSALEDRNESNVVQKKEVGGNNP